MGQLPAQAQTSKLNYGLAQPQDPATLPQAKAPFVAPTRRAKVPPRTVLSAAPDGQFTLTQSWELAAANQVPVAAVYLVRVTLANEVGKQLSTNDYWQKASATADFWVFNSLPAVRLVRQDAATHTLTYELLNPTATPAVAVRLTLQCGQQPVLPGERRLLAVQYPRTSEGQSLSLRAEAYNTLPE